MTVVALRNQNTPLNQTFNDDQVKLIKSTIAKGATDDELQLFLYQAQKTGLDPLARQIHFVKRAGQMTIQTAIDGFRAIAARTGQHAGTSDGIFEVQKGIDRPSKATVVVKKIVQGIVSEFSATARWDEYFPGEKQGFMWKKMPYTMLEKCAEAKALRKAFPEDLSGIYTNDEMQQADKKDIKSVSKPPPQQISESDIEILEKHHPSAIIHADGTVSDEYEEEPFIEEMEEQIHAVKAKKKSKAEPEEEIITDDLTPDEIVAQVQTDLQMIIRDTGGNVVFDAECLKRFLAYCDEQGFKSNRKHWINRLGEKFTDLNSVLSDVYTNFSEDVLKNNAPNS